MNFMQIKFATTRQIAIHWFMLLGALLSIPLIPANAGEVCIKELGKAPPNDRFLGPMLSPNGERMAYVLRTNNQAIMVCDGKEGSVWEAIVYTGISPQNPFSEDGKRLPYQARRDGEMFLVFADDEKPIPMLSNSRVAFSSDGLHYAYGIEAVGEAWFIVDGKEGLHHKKNNPGTHHFSPDGKRFAYNTFDDQGKVYIMLDGQPLKAYDKIGNQVFSPDSKRLAFTVVQNGKALVVCDNQEGKLTYPETFYPLFSPDSKSLAYWARSADRKTYYVIWNDQEMVQMKGEPQLAFSPDSKSLACTTYQGEMYRFGEKGELLAAGFEAASKPVFSPDSRHIAYAVGKEKNWRIAVDNNAFSGSYDPQKVMHWDGPAGGGSRMTLDAPGFSADGKHVYAVGFRGTLKPRDPKSFFIVCDGVEGPSHDGLWFPPEFQNHAKVLRYVVQDGDQARLMEWAWPKDKTWQDGLEKPPVL
jgi:Tol biopolymer transport system component